MSSTRGSLQRLYTLDALRGIAALAVVFWHWQHFSMNRYALKTTFQREAQPLYGAFSVFYEHGALAVDLFFSLSGFIFFWLYAQTIGDRRISAREFFVLRFSRLYPLYLCTLLLVLLGQGAYVAAHQHFFVFWCNDLWHFILNVFFMQSIGLEMGLSFNAPAWSVSVEVFLYAVFFAVCRLTGARPLYLIGLSLGFSLAGYLVVEYELLRRGLVSFFLGGATFYLFDLISQHKHRRFFTVIAAVLAAGMWAATSLLWSSSAALRGLRLDERVTTLFPIAIVFPMTILTLALLESARSDLTKRISFLGDISYSSYLLHFPLQLAFVLAMPYLGVTMESLNSAAGLLVFFSMLIALSFLSHRYFEMPAQRYLRGKWLGASREPRAEMSLARRLLYTALAFALIFEALSLAGVAFFVLRPWYGAGVCVIAYGLAPFLARALPFDRKRLSDNS
jgi:peptidoglycan/LPS O-acetylase OafA/YrhL